MQNICVLTKFPNILLAICKLYFRKNYDKSLITNMISPRHYAIILPNDFLKKVNAFLPVPLDRIDLYRISPGAELIPHIDRGRKTALQIPIDIDTEHSYTFAAKYEDLKMLTPKNHQYETPDEIVVNKPGCYEWNDTLYDKYNLSKPIIQNVSMPHGGVNFSTTDRIFMSGNYVNDEYKYVVEAFKDFY